MDVEAEITRNAATGRFVATIPHPVHGRVLAAGASEEEAVQKAQGAIARLDG